MRTLPIEPRYETFSYLPPLTDQQVARQIQYTLDQGYFPCIEFCDDPKPLDPKMRFVKCRNASPSTLTPTSALWRLIT
jgi:ribulose bisphosphate carboxylase small subunit